MTALTESKLATLGSLEEALAGMHSRLLQLLSGTFDQDTFVELTAIYNNVAYAFLYLEANEEYEQLALLSGWRSRFYEDVELNQRVIAALRSLECENREAEDARLAYLAQMLEGATPRLQGDDPLEVELQAAKSALDKVETDRRALLQRIGVDASGAPSLTFYRLTTRMQDPATRSKLSVAWRAQADRHLDSLVASVDRMVSIRRERARDQGFSSVTERTFAKCSVDIQTVGGFVDEYLRRAQLQHQELLSEVEQAVAVVGDPLDHFSYYMKVRGGATQPLFVLEDCLRYIYEVAEACFGLRMVSLPSRQGVLKLRVEREGEEIGQVNFDLWNTQAKAVKANQTIGLRNRTDWNGVSQTPVAYVSCRFQRDRGANRITLQNVHSLFHEFGHALNHVCMRHRIPNRSGLEYLPIERLELLSMWFEKWIYHPQFAVALSLDDDAADATRLACQMKAHEYRRTYLYRGLTAALDLAVHSRPSGGLREAWEELDSRYGLAGKVVLGDVAEYFTWPMYQAHPGANFSYIWGTADSCQKFAPFTSVPVNALPGEMDVRKLFASSFEHAVTGPPPEVAAGFRFYEGLTAEPVQQGRDGASAPSKL